MRFLLPFFPKYSSLIQSLLSFYGLFGEAFDDSHEQSKKASYKEIRECELLVGWDSNNFHILKATVEKFHKKLYKVGKTYKEYLENSFETVISKKPNVRL